MNAAAVILALALVVAICLAGGWIADAVGR
jgi:hypothetical protein